mmetsp:Transcript_26089/g.68589  ORF Transcript_26089/g.68589 Transcript_26089/m.68589 type:complete len:562 (-) Transcript_26089:195-1880(-)
MPGADWWSDNVSSDALSLMDRSEISVPSEGSGEAPLMRREVPIPVPQHVPDEFLHREIAVLIDLGISRALAFLFFLLLLYGHYIPVAGFSWFHGHEGGMWFVVFLPLFLFYLRLLLFARDLGRCNVPKELLQHCIQTVGELVWIILICISLAYPGSVPMEVAVVPYAAGWTVPFLLRHLSCADPTEDSVVGSFLAVTWWLGEIGGFLIFAEVLTMSLSSQTPFTEKLWPCWFILGIAVVVVVVLLLTASVTMIWDRPLAWTLMWVMVFVAGFAVSLLLGMINLNEFFCHDPSQQNMSAALLPATVYLSIVSFVALCGRKSIVARLYTAFQPPPAPPTRSQKQLPSVMFRLSPTYYSRHFSKEVEETVAHMDSLGSRPEGAVWKTTSSMMQSRLLFRSSASQLSGASGRSPVSSLASSVVSASESIDQASVNMAARGSMFSEMVEQENKCFICYDKAPDAIFLECGHAGTCVDCAVEWENLHHKCSICRRDITNVVKIRRDLEIPRTLFAASSSHSLAMNSFVGMSSQTSLSSRSLDSARPVPRFPLSAMRFAVSVRHYSEG